MEKYGMVFHLFDIHKVVYERGTSHKAYEMDIKIAHSLKKDEQSSDFDIYLIITILSKDEQKPLTIIIEAMGHFSLAGEVPEHILDNYFNISAPSIVYPYLRAFISNFTLQTGINAIILPPINFAVKAQQKNEHELTEEEDIDDLSK